MCTTPKHIYAIIIIIYIYIYKQSVNSIHCNPLLQSTLSKVMTWWWLSQVITPLPAWNDPTKHSSDNMFCFQTTIPKFFKTHHQKSSCEIHGCFWTSKPMAAVPASSRRRRLPLASNSTVPPSSWRRDGLIYLNQFVAAFGSVNKYIHTYVYMKIHIYIYIQKL